MILAPISAPKHKNSKFKISQVKCYILAYGCYTLARVTLLGSQRRVFLGFVYTGILKGTQPLLPIWHLCGCKWVCMCWSQMHTVCILGPTRMSHCEQWLYPCSCCILVDVDGTAFTSMHGTPLHPCVGTHVPHTGVRLSTPMWVWNHKLYKNTTVRLSEVTLAQERWLFFFFFTFYLCVLVTLKYMTSVHKMHTFSL